MPEPTKIPRPFADSGDKNSIPDSSGGIGFASWQEGFPAITGTPFAQGGVAPKRADFNGIFNALSLATLWQQQGGFYAYDATTDYEVGNVVEYNNDLYKCLSANGPSSAVKAPTDTTVWSKVMTAADAAAAYLPLSGGVMTNSISFNTASGGVRSTTSANETRVCGGTDLSDGASFIAYGKDSIGTGSFRVKAYGNYDLVGSSSGVLTWKGYTIYPTKVQTLGAQNIVFELENKLQFIAYSESSVANGGTVTFPRAFTFTPIVIATHPGSAFRSVQAYSVSTTSFNVSHSDSGSIRINYIAVGVGAV